jgi:hypothetical protein
MTITAKLPVLREEAAASWMSPSVASAGCSLGRPERPPAVSFLPVALSPFTNG